jgi:hypothetical protein
MLTFSHYDLIDDEISIPYNYGVTVCHRLPKWVKRVGLTMRRSLLVFPYKQTSLNRADRSVSCR